MNQILYQEDYNPHSCVTASFDVPRFMKALVVNEPGDYRFKEKHPTPQISPDEVLGKVKLSGLCHTDLLLLEKGLRKAIYSIIGGHEYVFEIIAVGREVPEGYLNHNGVVRALVEYCGKCYSCMREEYNLCRSSKFTGVEFDGGFAEFSSAKYTNVTLVDGINPEDAFALGDALMTARHMIKKLRITKNDSGVNIYGVDGGLGISSLINLFAIGMKPSDINGIGVRENFLNELKERTGINVFNSYGKPIGKAVRKESGYKTNVAIDCFGSGGTIESVYEDIIGALEKRRERKQRITITQEELTNILQNRFMTGTVRDAIDSVVPGGRVGVIGARPGEYMLGPVMEFMGRELTISGPWGGTEEDVKDVMKLIKNGDMTKDHLALLRGAKFPFTEYGVHKAIESLKEGKYMGRGYFVMTDNLE